MNQNLLGKIIFWVKIIPIFLFENRENFADAAPQKNNSHASTLPNLIQVPKIVHQGL